MGKPLVFVLDVCQVDFQTGDGQGVGRRLGNGSDGGDRRHQKGHGGDGGGHGSRNDDPALSAALSSVGAVDGGVF